MFGINSLLIFLFFSFNGTDILAKWWQLNISTINQQSKHKYINKFVIVISKMSWSAIIDPWVIVQPSISLRWSLGWIILLCPHVFFSSKITLPSRKGMNASNTFANFSKRQSKPKPLKVIISWSLQHWYNLCQGDFVTDRSALQGICC